MIWVALTAMLLHLPFSFASCGADLGGSDLSLLNYQDQRWLIEAEADYSGVQEFVNRIVKNFSPNKYYYVLIGASSTAYQPYLEILFRHGVANLPMSKKAFGLWKPGAQIPTDLPENFEKNLDEFFPNKEELGDKIPLLIEILYSGKTLETLNVLIPKYLKKRSYSDQFEILAVNDMNKILPLKDGWTEMEIAPGHPLHDKLGGQIYKSFRKYPTYQGDQVLNKQDIQIEYTVYRDRMRAKMKTDEKIPKEIRDEL